MATTFAIVGFLIAAYSIVANDAIQTLGTFLSSNAKRPWWLLWCFACAVLLCVFVYGWIVNDGDVSFGRLSKFPEPEGGIGWLHVIPPLVILFLTRFGIPVSTTFLVLSVFAPSNMTSMLTKSLLGYVVAFLMAIGIYTLVTKTLEKRLIDTADQPPQAKWIALQWCSTAFLWSQWLMHDLANIFVYLPRHLNVSYFFFATCVMLFLHAVIFVRRGGEIQHIVTSKTNTQDIRSATIIDFIYGIVLLIFKEYSNMPMSTTWVFLGLLAGRETAITLLYKVRSMTETSGIVLRDAGKAGIGLGVSVALAFSLPLAYKWMGNEPTATAAAVDSEPTTKLDDLNVGLVSLPAFTLPTELTGTIRCAGSDTLRRVAERWEAQLAASNPGLEVELNSLGSASAPPALSAGDCDIGLMSRRMTAEEAQEFRDKFGYRPSQFTVAFDALAIYVHRDNPLRGLTLGQLASVFGEPTQLSPGITRWSKLVFEPFSDEDIDLFGRDEASGTRQYFRDVVLGSREYRSDIKSEPDSAVIVQLVGEQVNAMGYSGMGYRNNQVRTIAIARHDDDPYFNYFVPNYKDDPNLARRFAPVYSGEYPLSRLLYLYVNKPPGKGLPAELNAFVEFVLSRPGQQIVLEEGFIPLTAELLQAQREKLSPDYSPKWYEGVW